MKVKIKVSNVDPAGLKDKILLQVVLVLLGSMLALVGGIGLVLKIISHSRSVVYQKVMGTQSVFQFLLGGFMLWSVYLIRKSKPVGRRGRARK